MKICPYLGLQHDPQTPALFPSERNFCHRTGSPHVILDTHQQSYCLVAEHQTCPIFNKPEVGARREVIQSPAVPAMRPLLEKYRTAFLIILGALFLAGFLFLGWNFRESLALPAAPTALPVVEQPSTPLTQAETPEAASASPAVTPTLSFTPTPTQLLPTETASLTLPVSLETLIGENPSLLIHRVARGESLTSLADRYGTTPEAIQAVNFVMPLPLWLDWLVVIPIDTLDAGDLPRFEVYQVTEDDLSVSTLAETFEVDVSLLAKYNDLQETDLLTNGSWVLVPRTTQ